MPETEVREAAVVASHENASEVEEFIRRQESGSNTLAVLERPDEPVAVQAVENLAADSTPAPERVEIVGSRLGGTINLTDYSAEEQSALMDALQELIPR